MSTIVSSLLATAEIPLIKLRNLRSDKTLELIEQLEHNLENADEAKLILELLLDKDIPHVCAVFTARLARLDKTQHDARAAYRHLEHDATIDVETLLSLRIAELRDIERFCRAHAAHDLYLVAAARHIA